ncbi:aromatic acid exporter family protein [Nocardiopsis mangrovi]|uniref:Aromatic acid exporter family protein n=1 Tax=Nocardiopsis mangrovi TaxID=1179818 RepID=A0ABV9DR58_9ACTN
MRGRRSGERQTVSAVVKGAIAATAAWAVAAGVLDATAPAFAPFSALLMLQITIYRSVVQSVYYMLAVSAGVAVQGLLAFAAGPDLLTFAVVAVLTLVIGRGLGSQGQHVPTAAFFAFSQFVLGATSSERLSYLTEIVLLVVLGCAIGVAVNLLLFPPLRYTGATRAVETLIQSVSDLLQDMSESLCEATLDEDPDRDWRARASAMGRLVAQARSSVETARESQYLHPARFLSPGGRGRASFPGAETVLNGLDRIAAQLGSVARGLADQSEEGRERRPDAEFLHAFGRMLAHLRGAALTLCPDHSTRFGHRVGDLDAHLDRARTEISRLDEITSASRLGGVAHAYTYGTLLVDAGRLVEEYTYIRDVLRQQSAPPPPGAGRKPARRFGRRT